MTFTLLPDRLAAFCRGVLERLGVPQENATLLTEALLAADLQGIGTHGVSRLPIYAQRIEAGLVNGHTQGQVVRRRGVATLIDGENGMGQVVAARAVREAIATASASGVGLVGVRRSNHFGVAGYYCEMAAREGMIGFAFTNGPAVIPPWGGRRPYFGTNPVACAIPAAGLPPVVIDLSASVVSRGSIILAAKTGEEIPSGLALDPQGEPTTDARRAMMGAIMPMAGAKGYALALMVEVLAGALTGAAFGTGVQDMYGGSAEPADVGHLFLVIDPGTLMERELFLARMRRMADEICAIPPQSGTEAPRLPGARRHAAHDRHMKAGIPIPAAVVDELRGLGDRLGVPFPD